MPVRAASDSRRAAAAAAAYEARQKEAGVLGVTVRLDEATRAKLVTLAKRYGPKDAAMVAAIDALAAG